MLYTWQGSEVVTAHCYHCICAQT